MPKSLLAMTLAAAAVAVVGIAGGILAFDQMRAIGDLYMVAVIFVTAWCLLFAVLTLLRARATPIVTCAGLVLWVAFRLCVAAATGGWPLVVDLLAEAVLAAGFCGYMLGSDAAKAHYRRRLPAP
jgi:hypothetical protein